MTRSSFRDLFSIDIRSLAMFRMGLVLLLLCDLIDRSQDLTAHYTDYVVATVSKLQSDAWIEGRALYAILNKASYVRPLDEWLLDFAEVVTFAVVANFAFQCGISICLNISYFQPFTALAVIPYLPSTVWDRSSRFRLPATGADGDTSQAPQPGRIWHYAGSAVAGLLLAYVIESKAISLFPGYM